MKTLALGALLMIGCTASLVLEPDVQPGVDASVDGLAEAGASDSSADADAGVADADAGVTEVCDPLDLTEGATGVEVEFHNEPPGGCGNVLGTLDFLADGGIAYSKKRECGASVSGTLEPEVAASVRTNLQHYCAYRPARKCSYLDGMYHTLAVTTPAGTTAYMVGGSCSRGHLQIIDGDAEGLLRLLPDPPSSP